MTQVPSPRIALTTLAAIAAAGIVSLASAAPVEARGGHHHRGISIHLGGGHLGLHGRHHRHGHRHVYFAGGSRCGWLYRKALHTGSDYWWDRYQNCRHGY